MADSQNLLAEYVSTGSELAFRELVSRYVNLVYSTALRVVGGDTQLAEDAAQTVFVQLARKARSLPDRVMLGGWLHRATINVAATMVRGESRRKSRERQAVEMNTLQDHTEANLAQVAPILDEAIDKLDAEDRAAILLRFFEQLEFRSVGELLGSNEEAARKRVSRALEKLHSLLKHRGVSLSVAAFGTALATEAVTAAPAGLAASIAGPALASAATGTGTTFILLKCMAATKLKAGMVTAIIVASMLIPLVVQLQARARLREQDEALRRQTDQLAHVTADSQRLADLFGQVKNTQPSSDSHLPEVLRLRNEVGLLRRNIQEMTSANAASPLSAEDQLAAMKKAYAAQVDRLKQWLETHASEKIPELQNLPNETWIDAVGSLAKDDDFAGAARILRANAEGHVFSTLWPALRKYAGDNGGQFPADLSELKPYFKSPIDDAILQRYEILPSSSLVSELQPGGDWVITEKAPVNPALDLRSAYGLTQMRMADERVTNRWAVVQ